MIYNMEIFEYFQKKQFRLVNNIDTFFIRYQYMEKIGSNDRLIGLIGSRGVGKTTLLLQYLQKQESSQNYLYFSADDIAIEETSLYSLAEQLVERGGELFIVDEIHLYSNWAREIKNIYDSFPKLKIRFSGSSMLQILYEQFDLSRRAVIVPMEELSFREYYQMSTNSELPILSFDEILSDSIEISNELVSKNSLLFNSFDKYLKYGAYPFFIENPETFRDKLFNSLEKVIIKDIPSLNTINNEYLSIVRRLIYRLSEARLPYKVNVTKLAGDFNISTPTLYNILEILTKTRIFKPLKKFSTKISRKPEKLYFHNSNILHAFSEEFGFECNIGTIRETFFASNFNNIYYTGIGDFLVNKTTFEVGGRNKNFSQIKNIPNSFLAIDIDSTMHPKKIPLWLFGLLR